jgi:serine kinase of HPr protein (carbohydrate metabolism regulator)
MSDIDCIIFARNKKVTEDMVNLAKENEMTIIRTPCSVFKTSGELYGAGIEPIF